jgi:hypothetical protein
MEMRAVWLRMAQGVSTPLPGEIPLSFPLWCVRPVWRGWLLEPLYGRVAVSVKTRGHAKVPTAQLT